MGSSKRGVVLLKNGPEYILGRYHYKPEEAARAFFTHEIFKLDFPMIWIEFRKLHSTMISKHEQSEQPKSLFFEDGLQIELMDTKRDFTSRQIFRDFITGPMIQTISGLGHGDGFYEDVNSNDTWVYVDFANKLIYIDGIKVVAEGTPAEEIPIDTPMMVELRKHGSSYGVVHAALDRLKNNTEILKFFMEYVSWISKYADLPEDRENPLQAVQRIIGHHFMHFGSSTRQKWRNACDYNYKSIPAEYSKFKVVKIPGDLLGEPKSEVPIPAYL